MQQAPTGVVTDVTTTGGDVSTLDDVKQKISDGASVLVVPAKAVPAAITAADTTTTLAGTIQLGGGGGDPPGTVQQIFIRDLTGKCRTMEIKPEFTVDDIKKGITDMIGIPVEKQRLVFKGRELQEGGKTCGAYGIKKEDTLHLVLRLPGGRILKRKKEEGMMRNKND